MTTHTESLDKDWIDIHIQSCVGCVCFSRSVRAMLTFYKQQQQQQEEGVNNRLPLQEMSTSLSSSSSWRSMDAIMSELSKTCLIISPSWIEKDASQRARILLELDRERRYSLFVLKNLQSLSVSSSSRMTHSIGVQQEQHEESSESMSVSSLWKKFALLDIDIDSKRIKNTSQDDSHHSRGCSGYSPNVLDAIGQVVGREILFQIEQHDGSHLASVVASDHIRNTNNRNTNIDVNHNGGKMSYLSKRFYHNVSFAVKSVMASWDLIDDHWTSKHTNYTTGNLQDKQNDQDEDDANRNPNGMLSDVDDAMSNIDSNKPQARTHSNATTEEQTLTQDDILWNTNLFIQCWQCVVNYAQSIIQQQEEINRSSYSMTVVVHEDDPEICGLLGVSTSTKGILLRRHGEDSYSFASFCREAGRYASSGRGSAITGGISGSASSITNVGKLLQSLTRGLALEILLSCLVMTNKAKIVMNCEDKDIVVLFPSTVMVPIVDRESTIIQLDKVDVAIFQITCAIHGLEGRVGQLEQQMEVAHQKTLEAKQNKNTPLALLHLKRRKMLQQEIERCMATLVNLETGLHTIKRTKDDVELVKTFELMNESLKAIRMETSLEHVEELMQELEENTLELNDYHNALHANHVQDNHPVDEEELERELNQLVLETKPKSEHLLVEGIDHHQKWQQQQQDDENKEVTTAKTDKVSTAVAI